MLYYLEKVNYLQESLSASYLYSGPPHSISPNIFRNVTNVILYIKLTRRNNFLYL
jgi:hypothetical protein